MHSDAHTIPVAHGRARFALAGLVVGSFLLGMAQVSVLPPFEGADETAHYSYVQQLAETARWPRLGDLASDEIDKYRDLAPLPKSAGGPWSYRTFFESSADVIAAAHKHIHQPRDASRGYTPGRGENWQAQHPPLYYLLLSPLYLATKSWSLSEQLFALRLFSYLLAWSAIGLAIATALRAPRREPRRQTAFLLAPALWPALFPMWFPEMARLGNDSLVAAVSALAWMSLVRLHAEPARARHYVVLGTICGLGLLTKATMMPVVAVAGGFLIFRAFKDHGTGVSKSGRVARVALFFVAICLVAGWWYGLKMVETGNLLGSFDVNRLEAAGGLLKGLQERMNLRDLFLGLLLTVLTFVWGGTWSFVMPALPLFFPFVFLLLLLAIGWLKEMLRKCEPLDVLPAITAMIFIAALARHTVVLIALVGPAVAPGWLLHGIMPVLAPAVGLALAGATESRATRWLTCAALIYGPAFLMFAMVAQALFYAGCDVLRPSPFIGGLIGRTPCGLDVSIIYERLSVLAYPQAATILLVVGGLVLFVSVICASIKLRPLSLKH